MNTKSVLHKLAHTTSTWGLHATKNNTPTLKTKLKLRTRYGPCTQKQEIDTWQHGHCVQNLQVRLQVRM